MCVFARSGLASLYLVKWVQDVPASGLFFYYISTRGFSQEIPSEISSIYKYDVTIKNRLDNSQEFDFSIIMQLKEGTDFVMSFSIK